MRKNMCYVVGLIAVLLSTQMVAIASNGSYDPWMDLNDDGIIDAQDLQLLALIYSTSGTPINKTALLLELEARINSLNTTLLTEYYNITECDVIFVDASGDIITGYLNVDSGTLYVDDVNDRVGIGTLSPGAPLEVSKAGGGELLILRAAGGAGPEVALVFRGPNSIGQGRYNYGKVYGISTGDESYADMELRFALSTGVSSWKDVMTLKEGKVGIGTTAPGRKLHVIGGTQFDGNVYLNGSGTRYALYRTGTSTPADRTVFYGGSGDMWFETATGDISFRTYDSGWKERLYITQAGNVGIGTTNPNEKLTIEGALSLDEISAPSPTSGYGKLYVKTDNKLYFKDDVGTEYDLTGGISCEDCDARFVNEGQADSITSGMITDGTITGSDISTSASLTIGGLDVDSGTLYVDDVNDKVGIGTPSPEGALEVSKTGGGEVLTLRAASGAGPEVALVFRGPNSIGQGRYNYGKVYGISTGATGYKDMELRFALPNGTSSWEDIMTLKDSDVGIGTSTPAYGYKLDVEGKVQATSFDTGDITFRKDGEILWRMFEDEDGLYLENLKNDKVYSFVLQEAESGKLLEFNGTHLNITEGVVGFIVALGLVFGVNKYKAKKGKEEADPQQSQLSLWQ